MKTIIMILISLVMASGPLYGQSPDPPPPVPPEEQPEVLTRGPVNEAFAHPVNIEEESGFIAPEAPPPDIEEIPPAEAPAGEQFAWIPGYWAWDSDRDEYIWISGCWRAVPPGKYWVPGYWAEVEDGWIWVAGFWASTGDEEIKYLPAPPPVKYIEPIVKEAPGRIWVPPCWYWSHGRYTLRAGYLIKARKDWIWIPSHYVWTPRGHVFVDGYWDYPFRSRGVLFAPVYFPGHVHRRVGFSYSLNIVVDLGGLEFGIFTRPRYCHYYFGDYYDSFYIDIGIFPWFDCVIRHTWYDPIYLHDRWQHQRDKPRWLHHVRWEYERRRIDKKLRPPRTYRELERGKRKVTESRERSFEVAAPIKRFIEKKTTTFKFREHKPEDRRKISRSIHDIPGNAGEKSQRKLSSKKVDRKVKKRVPAEERKAGNVKESRRRNMDTTASKTKSVEKNKATAWFQKQEQEVQNQASKHINDAQKNDRERDQRESTVKVSRPDWKVIKSVPTSNVQAELKPKKQDLKPQEHSKPSQQERGPLSEVPERNRTRTMVSDNQVKPSYSLLSRQKQDKPGSVKVKSSPVVHKKKSRSSVKKQASLPAEELDKKEEREKREEEVKNIIRRRLH